jgi:hypothetical protein
MTMRLITGLIICAFLLTVLLVGNLTPTRATPVAANDAGVELSPGYLQTATPGQIVTYTHTLTNTGTTTDTFTLDASSSQGWAVALVGSSGIMSLPLELDAGLTATFFVSLTVAPDAISGTLDMAVITATSQTSPTVWISAVDTTTVENATWTVYLPLVLKRWPPIPDAPVLNPISNADDDGNYTVTWNAADLATSYTLQEADNAAFANPVQRYSGSNTDWATSTNSGGTYYYRVKASSSWGDSGWSNLQAVVALPGIHGRVTYQGAPAAGIVVDLLYDLSLIHTTTQADGTYYFSNLTPGTFYHVDYDNESNVPTYIRHCSGSNLPAYTSGARQVGSDYDIANIVLQSPPSGATIAVPYTFKWTPRPGVPSDSYSLEIFDAGYTNVWNARDLGYVGQYTLNSLPNELKYPHPYMWWVWVGAPGATCISSARSVTFSSSAANSYHKANDRQSYLMEDFHLR